MPAHLVYGIPTHRCGLQLRLGIEKGFFRDEGLDLTLQVVFGGPEIAAQLSSGGLLIGELGTPPGLTALASGARFKIVGSSVRRGVVQFMVAHPKIAGWHDLRGTALGVLSHGSCSDWYMRKLLVHHGIDPDRDVRIVALGLQYPKILELLSDRELDGAIMSEPHVTMGEEAGLFKVWLGLNRLDYVPPMQWSIVVANDWLLAREQHLVAAVLRGCRRSYWYAAEHRDEWADFGARYFGIKRETMLRSIAREFDGLHFDCEIDVDGMNAAIALQRNLGSVSAPLGLSDIIDSRFSSELKVPANGHGRQ